jgi:hypothetical protein
MRELELRKVASGPRAPRTRYDLHLQPLLNREPLPRCEKEWIRELDLFDTTNMVLDQLAVDIMKNSLEGDLVVGDTVCFFLNISSSILICCVQVGPATIFRVREGRCSESPSSVA